MFAHERVDARAVAAERVVELAEPLARGAVNRGVMGGEFAVERLHVFAHERVDARAVAAKRVVELAEPLARGGVESGVMGRQSRVDLREAFLRRGVDPLRVRADSLRERAEPALRQSLESGVMGRQSGVDLREAFLRRGVDPLRVFADGLLERAEPTLRLSLESGVMGRQSGVDLGEAFLRRGVDPLRVFADGPFESAEPTLRQSLEIGVIARKPFVELLEPAPRDIVDPLGVMAEPVVQLGATAAEHGVERLHLGADVVLQRLGVGADALDHRIAAGADQLLQQVERAAELTRLLGQRLHEARAAAFERFFERADALPQYRLQVLAAAGEQGGGVVGRGAERLAGRRHHVAPMGNGLARLRFEPDHRAFAFAADQLRRRASRAVDAGRDISAHRLDDLRQFRAPRVEIAQRALARAFEHGPRGLCALVEPGGEVAAYGAEHVLKRLTAHDHRLMQPVGGFVEAAHQRLAALADRRVKRAACRFQPVDQRVAGARPGFVEGAADLVDARGGRVALVAQHARGVRGGAGEAGDEVGLTVAEFRADLGVSGDEAGHERIALRAHRLQRNIGAVLDALGDAKTQRLMLRGDGAMGLDEPRGEIVAMASQRFARLARVAAERVDQALATQIEVAGNRVVAFRDPRRGRLGLHFQGDGGGGGGFRKAGEHRFGALVERLGDGLVRLRHARGGVFGTVADRCGGDPRAVVETLRDFRDAFADVARNRLMGLGDARRGGVEALGEIADALVEIAHDRFMRAGDARRGGVKILREIGDAAVEVAHDRFVGLGDARRSEVGAFAERGQGASGAVVERDSQALEVAVEIAHHRIVRLGDAGDGVIGALAERADDALAAGLQVLQQARHAGVEFVRRAFVRYGDLRHRVPGALAERVDDALAAGLQILQQARHAGVEFAGCALVGHRDLRDRLAGA